jgi:hypothetical protein
MEERRDALRQHAAAAALIGALGAGLIASSPGAAACELPPGKRLASGNVALTYRTVPAKVAVGEHFEVHFAACLGASAVVSGQTRADAHMPEHRHGTNYRPSIAASGAAGAFRSQGWLFHMAGRWEFVFEIGGERLTDSVRIE